MDDAVANNTLQLNTRVRLWDYFSDIHNGWFIWWVGWNRNTRSISLKIDRFGNFIGEAEESEEESQHETTAADPYLDDEEEEEEAAVNNQQLMELDGA